MNKAQNLKTKTKPRKDKKNHLSPNKECLKLKTKADNLKNKGNQKKVRKWKSNPRELKSDQRSRTLTQDSAKCATLSSLSEQDIAMIASNVLPLLIITAHGWSTALARKTEDFSCSICFSKVQKFC